MGGPRRMCFDGGPTGSTLNGTFNNVPVLHSNQPEIATGPGILVDTAPGSAIAAESNQPLRNAAYTFNEAGVHIQVLPQGPVEAWGTPIQGLMVWSWSDNPGSEPITLRFDRGQSSRGAVSPESLDGRKPLGASMEHRPGDATAVQLLRGERTANSPNA